MSKQTVKEILDNYGSSSYTGNRVLAKGCTRSNDTTKTNLNNNDLIIGVSGTGKTSGYIIPNLYCAKHSMVVADTKGLLHKKMLKSLKDRGFDVHLVDFVHPENSETFNVLDIIRRKKEQYKDSDGNWKTRDSYDKSDLRKLVNLLIPDDNEDEKFWVYSPRNLLMSIIALALEVLPSEEQNMNSVLKIYQELSLQAEKFINDKYVVSIPLFDKLEELDPDSFAVSEFKMCRGTILAEKTWVCVTQVVSNALEVFGIPEYRKLLNGNTSFDFADLGRKKTMIFLNVSDIERSMDPIINVFYTATLQKLIYEADEQPEGRLKMPVRVILDDFASNVVIENFDKIISVTRSREIYLSVILQDINQLNGMYGEAKGRTIANNCDTTLYLGGSDPETLKYIARRINKASASIQKLADDKMILITRGQQYRVLEKIRYWTMDKEEMKKLDMGMEV